MQLLLDNLLGDSSYTQMGVRIEMYFFKNSVST